MAAVATHLADTSALARLRHPAVQAVLGPLIEAGLVAMCSVIEFELGWATRSAAEWDQVRTDREAGYEWVTILHYDSSYDLIAKITSQPTQWVVPAGTVS